MASMLLGSVGSSLLGPLGGWLGSALGSYVDNMLFAATPEDQYGPQLSDLTGTRADPGVAIPLVFGADRLPGIVIASTELIETEHKETVGGKGGPTQTVYSYTYHVDINYMLCEGPILGVGRIWAEGNLIRGTSYEMEISTSENPENVGGIPYPDYYRDHLYDPNLIPWTLDRTYFPEYDEGYIYIKSGDALSMQRISSGPATVASDEGNILYWKDTRSGYYIPYATDHAYGVSTEVSDGRSKFGGVELPFYLPSGTGNSNSGIHNLSLMDLGLTIDGGTAHGTAVTGVTIETAFGVDATPRTIVVQLDYYAAGTFNTIDGVSTGTPLGGDNYIFSHVTGLTTALDLDLITLPENTRFITVKGSYAMSFPIFAGDHKHLESTLSFGYWYTGDDEAAEQRDWPDYWNLYDAVNDWSDRAVLQYSGCDNITLYHGTMDQQSNEVMALALESSVPAYIGRAHVVFDRLELADFGNRIPTLSFEVVQFDDARISAILTDMMGRAQVDEQYWDIDALPTTGTASHVLGYTIGSKTSYRAAMETIMEAFRLDCAEIGNELVFRPRDRVMDFEIQYSELAAMEPGKDIDEIVKLAYRDPVEMPKSLTVSFKDVERAYQSNTAHFYRQQVVSVQESILEVACVMPPAQAKAYARDKMRDVWLERVSVSIKVPHKYVKLYPTDFVKIVGGPTEFMFKITKKTRGDNGVIELEGVLREMNIYVPEADEVTSTNMDGSTWNHRSTQIVAYGAPATNVWFMDTPPLITGDEDYGFYIAAEGAPGWKGCSIYRSFDGGASYSLIKNISRKSIAGHLIRPLPHAAPELIDLTNKITVRLRDSTEELSSVSMTQFYAGFNTCWIGGEMIQFKDATLVDAQTYELSTLMRGRYGTHDLDTLAHSIGDDFVSVRRDRLVDIADWLTVRNQSVKFKAVSHGSTLAQAEEITFANSGKRMLGLKPVQITGTRDVDGNLLISWKRQDRLYRGISNYADIPFADGGDYAVFSVDILRPGTTEVIRTIPQIGRYEDNTSEYSMEWQGYDGIAEGELIEVHVYQTSFYIGRGNVGKAIV